MRLNRIIRTHKRIADLCGTLVNKCISQNIHIHSVPLKDLNSDKIIWQYWAQGFENVPPVVADCLSSVDLYKGDYQVIRLSDANYSEYLQFPESILSKIPLMSKAHFSDILRVALLEAYGGVWMDATIMLTGEIPAEYLQMDYFVFQRDPDEPDKDYWENAYAYYYGWADDFKVNMLSSFMAAKKGNLVIALLEHALLLWWQENDYLPDYFLLQILYDVLINGQMQQHKCPIVSDCIPHYMQQSINDPSFNLIPKEEILKKTRIHKLTYKNE